MLHDPVDDLLVQLLIARESAAWEELMEAVCRRALMHAGAPHDASSVAAAEVHRALLHRVARGRFKPNGTQGASGLGAVVWGRRMEISELRVELWE